MSHRIARFTIHVSHVEKAFHVGAFASVNERHANQAIFPVVPVEMKGSSGSFTGSEAITKVYSLKAPILNSKGPSRMTKGAPVDRRTKACPNVIARSKPSLCSLSRLRRRAL